MVLLVFGVLSLLLIAFLGQLSMHTADSSLAFTRMKIAVARADARFALGQSLAAMSLWPGLDSCATAPGDLVPGSAKTRWTYCEKEDGTSVYLVSTLPRDSHAVADVWIAPAEGSLPDVYVPGEPQVDQAGRLFATTAWWAEDIGVKAPIAAEDGRKDARLFSDLSADAAEKARALLCQQMPGPYGGEDTSFTARRSAFVLCNPYDGGLREDLSALADTDASLYTHAPSAGEVAWMKRETPVGGGVPTENDETRSEPVVTEFLLAGGLAANLDQYKNLNLPQTLDILFSYHMYVEVWNPTTRTLTMGATSPDIRVAVKGLPMVSGVSLGAAPVIALPEPLSLDFDNWDNLTAGSLQLLSNPVYNGGSDGLGVWQTVVGSIVTNKFNFGRTVVLHFAAASPVVEFYDLTSSEAEPFYTLKLSNYAAFDMTFGEGNQFFRSAVLDTSYGMGRTAINSTDGGWAFAYHMRLKDDDLAKLLRQAELRDSMTELDASSGGDAYHAVLSNPAAYLSSGALMQSDFFASEYRINNSLPPRRALLLDPPAMEPVSFAALRHAPTEGRSARAVGAGVVEDADAELDRYFFSTLPQGEWDGALPLRNFRLIPAERNARVVRSTSDASGLLLKGGFNINSTSAEAWRAVLGSLAFPGWKMTNPAGVESTMDLSVPLFSMPWSAAFPPTSKAAAAILSRDTEAFANEAGSLYDDRSHLSYLVGVRDIGASADALAGAIASRIKARGHPFRSLAEFAGSGLLQDAIDSVPEINLREDGVDRIPRESPASVDQGELLSALSPILFTRSDTFLVRVLGRDEKTGTTMRGEAVIQRLPEAVDGNASRYGRRLKVMSLRWLGAQR